MNIEQATTGLRALARALLHPRRTLAGAVELAEAENRARSVGLPKACRDRALLRSVTQPVSYPDALNYEVAMWCTGLDMPDTYSRFVWGDWQHANGNGMRVGVLGSAVRGKVVWSVYTDNQYHYQDQQQIEVTGARLPFRYVNAAGPGPVYRGSFTSTVPGSALVVVRGTYNGVQPFVVADVPAATRSAVAELAHDVGQYPDQIIRTR